MKTAQKQHKAKPCLSARYTHAESDAYACNATHGSIGSGVGFGSPTWSRSTIWFRRPEDVELPVRQSKPVHSLQAIKQPKRFFAPKTVKPEVIVMSGKFAGLVTPNKTGVRATGDSSSDIKTALDKRFKKYVRKSKPSEAERTEMAQIREMKAAAKAVELSAIAERRAAIKHAKPSEADRKAEEARGNTLSAFEEMLLARKVINAEMAASDPAEWAEVQTELDAEMAV